MTTMSGPRQRETADQALKTAVRSVSDVVRAAEPDGLPLRKVLEELAHQGMSVPVRSSAITQLLRDGRVELTTDRRLRWVTQVENQ